MTTRDRTTLRARGKVIPRKARKWLYNTALAASPLAIAYGLISADTAPLWTGLAAALLAVPARANLTPED